MSNILITGGAGFIPSSLADVLSKNKNYNIVLVDNFLTGNKRKITKAPNVKLLSVM
jgi:nucleoside-diphosphate-sugar epimerase